MLKLSDAIGGTPSKIGDVLRLAARCYPNKVAIASSEFSVSFGAWDLQVSTLRDDLIRLGARRSQRWGVFTDDKFFFLTCLFALTGVGAIVTPLKNRESASQLRQALIAAGVQALVGANSQSVVETAKKCHLTCVGTLVTGESVYALESPNCDFGTRPIDLDPALMLLTSGTSGTPKPVMLQHHAVMANIRANVAALGYRDEDNTLLALPLHHAYGLVHQCLCHLAIGASIYILEKTLIPSLLGLSIEKFGISTIATVPPLLKMLVDSASHRVQPFASLRLVTVGAARAPEDTVRQFLKVLPRTELALTYGLTEAGPRVSTQFITSDSFDCRWVGDPLPDTELSIEDDRRIIVRSRSVMMGYAGVIGNTGLKENIQTNDLGKMEGDRIIMVGRADRCMNVGGTLLNAEDLEETLRRHSLVSSVVVQPQSDNLWGEIPIASVVPSGDMTAEVLAELKLFAIEQFGSVCSPLKVTFTELPEGRGISKADHLLAEMT